MFGITTAIISSASVAIDWSIAKYGIGCLAICGLISFLYFRKGKTTE